MNLSALKGKTLRPGGAYRLTQGRQTGKTKKASGSEARAGLLGPRGIPAGVPWIGAFRKELGFGQNGKSKQQGCQDQPPSTAEKVGHQWLGHLRWG